MRVFEICGKRLLTIRVVGSNGCLWPARTRKYQGSRIFLSSVGQCPQRSDKFIARSAIQCSASTLRDSHAAERRIDNFIVVKLTSLIRSTAFGAFFFSSVRYHSVT